jgi:hypothetical protein
MKCYFGECRDLFIVMLNGIQHRVECRYAECRGAQMRPWGQSYKEIYARKLRQTLVRCASQI